MRRGIIVGIGGGDVEHDRRRAGLLLALALAMTKLSDPEPLSLVLMTVNGLAMNVDAENADVPLVGSVTVAMIVVPVGQPTVTVRVMVVGLLALLLSVTGVLIWNERWPGVSR